MATTGRPEEPAPTPSDVAANCRAAGLVHLIGARRGDTLAAVGLLARALEDAGVPHQTRLVGPGQGTATATDADLTIRVGRADREAEHAFEARPVERAFAVAAELGDPEPALGLAGILAGNGVPEGAIYEAAMAADIERRPGLAIPTVDPTDGLAHSTLVHGSVSGEPQAATRLLEDAKGEAQDDRRRLASLVALDVATAAETARAGTAVERILRPYVGGPFETVGGYADVLDALARRKPGLGIAVALGHDNVGAPLEVWRSHGRAVHRAVREATLRRHDGLLVAELDGVDVAVLEPVAHLLRDYRSPEPAVLVRAAGRTTMATGSERDAATLLAEAGVDRAAAVVGDARLATIPTAEEAVVDAVREDR